MPKGAALPDSSSKLWDLERFPERLKLWCDLEHPSADELAVAEEWVATRKIDPTRGARIERRQDNFWFAQIPGSLRDGHVVVCSYWIIDSERLVRCDLFGTLSLPV